jgi:hypothetical protein
MMRIVKLPIIVEIVGYLGGDLEDCDMFTRKLSKTIRQFCKYYGNKIFTLIPDILLK